MKKLKLQVKVNGEGKPLILVPGGLTGWKSWEPFVEIFTAKQREVIMVQLLSVEYGIENSQLPENYSLGTESQALAETIDSLGHFVPVDIVAWSFGALVSLDYSLDHPERVRTLTLIEPPAIWVLRENGELDEQTKETLSFFESLQGYITDDMLEAFLKQVGLAGPPHDLPQWQQLIHFKQSLRNCPAVVNHNDELRRLSTFKSPVLLIKGTGSAPFLHKITDRLASHLPYSQVIEMPGGHAPHIVSREKFLSELEKFQRSH